MTHLAQDSLATIYFEFFWKSSHASHVERYLASRVRFTGDTLPLGVKSHMRGLGAGDSIEITMDSSEVPELSDGKVLDMPLARFKAPFIHGRAIRPRIGRYYPMHLIEDVPGTRPDSNAPFRVVEADKAGFKADLNHPMAGRDVTIRARVVDIHPQSDDPGKTVRWADRFFNGPGMQARLPETPTDYLGADPFLREDETGDADFYENARLVAHLDRQAQQNVRNVYSGVLENGMDVLDLMSSHISHLPSELTFDSVTGLGLNQTELDANPALTDTVLHNLNEKPTLPFDDESFDAIICTSSVEYLTRPFEVFEEAARVLRPGGVFALTFSTRWFEPKVIRIWPELHEFERMGLVSQFFVRSDKFDDLHTLSERGWPRLPDDEDRYYPELAESDPVYAVWGRKK
ncbi:methyltransferase domain-containing protein [uncultured Pseudodesulfovibrio sp.]|uniref:methyltransferase domain-containing protein n=1 Tax=uncultured Pseudodesulfovibrio sp. TaxID=2035858 RepID=UPI0029C7A3C8|nr:methyltransferase domain-containing protein [uncultured Pseudodesulfovibrio sp.]